MYLQKIEIHGFKSFAQKTTLEFPRPGKGCPLIRNDSKNGSSDQLTAGTCGIACIVGPNGSGKSNIVDAIRWVLGEQSLKSLRGKKSQDVIFSGSEKKSRLGMALVTLTINNEDGTMPLDYQEVLISRRIYRSGESEYRINKSKVRLQDVLLLIAKANFGQKSYSIVSQGSIDQIIMANPSDRKEYFDEAVGVKQFQLKRDQSINKLESAWNNLRQVDALLTEIKPRLNSLTRQVKRLERREKVENQLRAVQQQYYGWLWHELDRSIKKIKPELNQKETELKERNKALQEIQSKLRSLEKGDSRHKIFNDLQQRYQKILDQKNKLREEQLILQNKIELAKQRLTTKAIPLPLSDILSKLKEIDRLEEKILKDWQSSEPSKLAQTKEDFRELASLIKDLIKQLENPLVKERIKGEIDESLVKDLEAVGHDLPEIEKQLETARKEIENFNKQEEAKKGEFFALQRQITDQQNQYNQLSSATSELRVEMAKLETRNQDLEREIKEEVNDVKWLGSYKPEKINESEVHSEVIRLKHQLELIGGVDPEVVEEYRKVKERHDFLDGQAEDLRKSINSLEKVIDDLDDKIQVQFDTAFKNINREFGKFFKTLFGGGKAELILLKEEIKPEEPKKVVLDQDLSQIETAESQPSEPSILDTLTAAEEKPSLKRFLKKRTGKVITGIDITATPPGKKVSSINMLSGGERSLTSIALICAVISNNPSPFVILDEVDAALDEANSQRFSKILDELAHKTQFIVITHNRATMQQSNILYGVTMGDDGVSKLISLKMEEAQRIVRQ
ncbi:MAG: hypothetical protein A2731_02715 [Candidatus Buchananbacteria bacterium RIFCSPHIGHO2_01_FULL_39_8]|uniref:RecF/RecN/SMC N-terminal domain-containing protein n=1 Tax=Candidatus Buchananbacteria bacterium RIFCSPHIGHO2_01_FULL_39_8 TaxID=1797533 RepID=A0A1G1XVH5_9BACT|nr:MAG: hypothetical protein A2731_02715 [Candidatus Buchananbacteria bacterium RIFCSPHIGHO2_01_FULL_39_8]